MPKSLRVTTTHPHRLQVRPQVALALVLVGGTVFAAGADRFASIRDLGEVVLCAGLLLGVGHFVVTEVIAEVQRVNRPADDAFTEGYEAGYDRGWRDRNDEVRPNLVVLPSRSASSESADSCGPATQVPADRALS